MFQIVTAWNLVRPQECMKDATYNINLLGSNKETFLTGEFANKLATKNIRPLSVSNIADKYCPTRRDLYFCKGISRLNIRDRQETWGSKAGYIIEKYVELILRSRNIDMTHVYSRLIRRGNSFHQTFDEKNREPLKKLKNLEKDSLSVKKGDTDWLMALLSSNGRVELSLKILHSLLRETDSLEIRHVKIKNDIRPNVTQIGINSPATPDFIVPKFGIVGDIKTGVNFVPIFQLTCAGYALAYENEKKCKSKINWGIIYFFPTRNPSAYVKPITFAQIYIFPIDDSLRQWFLDIRDEAYKIISKKEPPDFPETNERKQCAYCRFKDHCVSQGLELYDYE